MILKPFKNFCFPLIPLMNITLNQEDEFFLTQLRTHILQGEHVFVELLTYGSVHFYWDSTSCCEHLATRVNITIKVVMEKCDFDTKIDFRFKAYSLN